MNTTSNTVRSSCSCGCSEDHVIARRKTADGIVVQIWSDGAVTHGLNTYVVRGRRGGYGVRKAVEAAWLLAGEVAMYDNAELHKLATAARKAVEQPSMGARAYLVAAMAGVKFQAIRKGAVIQHASDCPCSRCEGVRAANRNRPESERVYREVHLSNGSTTFTRIN